MSLACRVTFRYSLHNRREKATGRNLALPPHPPPNLALPVLSTTLSAGGERIKRKSLTAVVAWVISDKPVTKFVRDEEKANPRECM